MNDGLCVTSPIAALMLGFLALAPIMFWRLLMDKVIYYQAYNTFYVLCMAMFVLILFEMIFTYLRGFLVVHLTTRVDMKLRNYVFDKLLNLPIVFFERTQTGEIFHDIMELLKLRRFMVGQLLGTILDATVLLFFLPVMFFFSAAMTFWVLAFCAIIVAVLLGMLPLYRRHASAAEHAETERASFLVQTVHGIRTVKSLALDAKHRQGHDIHVARVARRRFAADMTANLMHIRREAPRALGNQRCVGSGCLSGSLNKQPTLCYGAVYVSYAFSARFPASYADSKTGQRAR